MLGNARMTELLREGGLTTIKRELDSFHPEGMQSFDHCLLELFKAGKITAEEAIRNSDNANDMRLRLRHLRVTITGQGDDRYGRAGQAQ
jgi:twitching motility protein PilU